MQDMVMLAQGNAMQHQFHVPGVDILAFNCENDVCQIQYQICCWNVETIFESKVYQCLFFIMYNYSK